MSKNFTTSNANALLRCLHLSGLDPDASTGPAYTDGLYDGDGYPRMQPGYLALRTSLSGQRLHQLALLLGLLPGAAKSWAVMYGTNQAARDARAAFNYRHAQLHGDRLMLRAMD